MAAESEGHGVLAAFPTPEALLAAADTLRAEGFSRLDALTPYPVEGLAQKVGFRGTRLPVFAFIGGVLGAAAIYGLEAYSVLINYPIDVGGRPLNSWPAFAIPAFECAVLGAALACFLGMLVGNGLPRLYHPVFNARSFSHANGDRFYLLVGTDDPVFDRNRLGRLLDGLDPISIEDVTP